MKRIVSKNPHRTEETRDQFDHLEGVISVIAGCRTIAIFPYTGNNIQESLECRNHALQKAEGYRDAFEFLYPMIAIIEEDEYDNER